LIRYFSSYIRETIITDQEESEMSRYIASRFVLRHLIFPQNVLIEDYHVRTTKRRFPWFWIVDEQSISLSKVASIKLHKGLFFSDVVIENSGGDFPIKIEGLTNFRARQFRQELERHERKLMDHPQDKAPTWAPEAVQPDEDPYKAGAHVKIHGLND
jgi:hypothetical protein